MKNSPASFGTLSQMSVHAPEAFFMTFFTFAASSFVRR